MKMFPTKSYWEQSGPKEAQFLETCDENTSM